MGSRIELYISINQPPGPPGRSDLTCRANAGAHTHVPSCPFFDYTILFGGKHAKVHSLPATIQNPLEQNDHTREAAHTPAGVLSMRLPSSKEATARVRPMLTESPLPGATNSQNSPCCHAGKPRVVGMAQWVTSTHVEDASAGEGASSFVRHSAFGMLTGRPWRA